MHGLMPRYILAREGQREKDTLGHAEQGLEQSSSCKTVHGLDLVTQAGNGKR